MIFKREISNLGILCASLGGIIGSGWLFGCLFAAQMAGPASIFSWMIGGVSIMFLALTYAEISTMFPISGGFASFPIFTHGKLVGFILTWITWITYVVSISQEVQSTIFYLGNQFPSWVHKVDGVTQLTSFGTLIAFIIMFVLNLLNSFGAKVLGKTNTILSIWKLLIPFAVVILFLYYAHSHGNHSFKSSSLSMTTFAPYGASGILSSVALAGVVYSFVGFQHGAMLAGEAKNPQKAVPLAMIGSLLICMLLYVGLQYAFIEVLPTSSLAQGWKNLSFIGDAGPLAGIASMLGITWLVAVLYIDSIVSPLGTGVLYVASSARVVQNMGTSGNVPKFFARLTKLGSPVRALILNFAISMLAFLPFKGWQAIVSFLSAGLVFSFAVGPLCLVVLRKQLPNQHRPFRLPFHQFFSFIAFYVCNLMIFWSGFHVVWKLSVTLLVGAIIFAFSNRFKEIQATRSDYRSAAWLIPYMSLFCILSYFSSFAGGIGKIPLGIDFLYVFLLSLIAFIVAQKTSLSQAECQENVKHILSFQPSENKKIA